MKRLHILSILAPHRVNLALAARKKGYAVTCYGENIPPAIITQLATHQIAVTSLYDLDEQKIDFLVGAHNPEPYEVKEYEYAKDRGLYLFGFEEFLLRMFKDKTRVVIDATLHSSPLLEMVLENMEQQHLESDYNSLSPLAKFDNPISMGYDARIALIEDKLCDSEPRSPLGYRPHILVITQLGEMGETQHRQLEEAVASIERDGKFIYNSTLPVLQQLALTVREDVTAIPHTEHPTVSHPDGTVALATRFGEIPITHTHPQWLVEVDAARLVCRHLGINEKEFYQHLCAE